MTATWIQTYTGRAFDLHDPKPEQVDPYDIAHSLSLCPRYTGHARGLYSVGQHSLHVAQLVPPRLRLRALLHDSPEYVLGDWSSPLKQLMRQHAPFMIELERRVERVIEERFGLAPAEPWEHDEIKRADRVMLATEKRDLLGPSPRPNWGESSGAPLHVLSEERAFDPDALGDYFEQHEVGVVKITPSHLKGLLQAARPERVLPRHTLVLGGEAASSELLRRVEALGKFQAEHLQLVAKPGVDVAYANVQIWLDQATGNVLKRQDFSVSGKLLRTTYYPQWNRVWSESKRADVYFPKEIRIFDEVQTDNKTTIVLQEIDLKTLDDAIFTKAYLESKSR